MDSSTDDVRDENENSDDVVVNGTKSQSSSLEHSSNSNLASLEGDNDLSNSVISAGAFSRIGNSLSSGSHSEFYTDTDTPTAAVDEDDGDDRLISNETFERLGSKLMQDCIRTPIEETACSNGDRAEGECNGTNFCNVDDGPTPRTHNISKPTSVEAAIDGEAIPTHLNLPNYDDDDSEKSVEDCIKSPEQRRLENQMKQIEAEITEAEHSLQEVEEEAQNELDESSIQNRACIDEDILMANSAVKSLQKQMEEADANVDALNRVNDIGDVDEHDSGEAKESIQPLTPMKSEVTAKRSIDDGNVRAPSTPSPRKQSQRKEQQLPPKSPPMDNSSLLSRGISMFRASTQVTPTPRRTRGMDNDNISVVSDITRGDNSPSAKKYDDGTLKRHLEESGLLLLKRLIEFLSECPPAPDEDSPIVPSRGRSPASNQNRKQRGLTLPASGIGWISNQIVRFDSKDSSEPNVDAFENTEDGYFVPKHQLQCVQFLMRRVVSVRISGEPWPPQAAATKKAATASANRVNQAGFSSRILSKFASDQSTVGESVDEESCGTSINDEQEKNLTPFQRYYRELQSKPFINMEIVPNATRVVIDGIPPNWVMNLDSLKNLEMFQMEKGCLLDANELFFPSDFAPQFSGRIEGDDAKESHHSKTHTDETNEQQSFVYSSLSKLRLSNCAIGEMSGLRGRSKRMVRQYQSTPHRPKRIPPLSRFPNLVSLNLSHNEIFRTKSAFAGLSSSPMLSSINLSYNRLSRLDDVFMYIGNVTELILTGNEITTTRGLDRLFSLERLSLNENKLHNLSDIAGVANLPFLMNLDLSDNPLMEDDTARIKVLNLFREVRCKNLPKHATYRDMQNLLPVLDNELATKDELVALKDFTFRPTVIPTESLTGAPASSQNGSETLAEGEGIVIETAAEISVTTPSKAGGLRRIVKSSTSHRTKVRVAGSLLLDDNASKRLQRFHAHLQQRKSNKCSEGKVSIKFSVDDLLTSICPDIDQGMSAIENDGDYLRRSHLLSRSHMSQCSRNENANSIFEDSDNMFPYSLPASLLEEASDDAWTPSLQADRITPPVTPAVWNETECSVNDGAQYEEIETKDVVTARVSFSSNTDFRSMYETNDHNEEESVDKLDLVEGPTTGMFDSVWEDTNKDTVREPDRSDAGKTTQPLDFQAAEENAKYDGPPDYSLLSVSRDLDLYFDTYVFPNDSDSNENDSSQNVVAPRIQMYKFDRDALTNSRKRDQELNPMGGDICERYLGVWREGVLACGPYARKRMAPARLRKRGFHGETTIRRGKEVAVSESRRYILCLSDMALYFIVDDEFSTRKNTSKRTFPSRMPQNSTFGDAQWPHAVVRHSLDSLKRIVIGFQFQRLTLQFFVSNSVSSSSFEYTYVVLTSNKAQTVSLLQKLQSYTSDTQPDVGFLIENDDKLFLDGLGAHSSEVVMHYQILHQVWKTGNREAARRSFVLTDSKIYLLDETYSGDGTNVSDENTRKAKLGDVSLAIIDEAKLSKVTEVRAANEDPRMITLVILPANKLKRAHRWRLVCNDGESAERLIDDVRNARQR